MFTPAETRQPDYSAIRPAGEQVGNAVEIPEHGAEFRDIQLVPDGIIQILRSESGRNSVGGAVRCMLVRSRVIGIFRGENRSTDSVWKTRWNPICETRLSTLCRTIGRFGSDSKNVKTEAKNCKLKKYPIFATPFGMCSCVRGRWSGGVDT